MTDRIRSQHGNVIAADFRSRASPDELYVTFKTDILCDDDHFLITRTTTTLAGEPVAVLHLAFNKATCRITQL